MIPALPDRNTAELDSINKGGVNRLPLWFRQDVPEEPVFKISGLLAEFNVNTVCQKARCPNLGYCWKNHQLTFMILGDNCSRHCRFCAVGRKESAGFRTDDGEPQRISRVIKIIGIKYAVITSVTRDDAPGAGAGHFARTLRSIQANNPGIKTEVLIPDFSGNAASIKLVLDNNPSVIGHNLETVRRLYQELKPESDYGISLEVLSKIKQINRSSITKSSLILGLGEQEEEVVQAMKDLRAVNCDILTLGQYLSPGAGNYAPRDFISQEQFAQYYQLGINLGFKAVLSGPLVRSSYRAEEVYKKITEGAYA